MSEFILYERSAYTELRPYVDGESMEHICVASGVVPEVGGMIARHPDDHSDQWYITPEYFLNNFAVVC